MSRNTKSVGQGRRRCKECSKLVNAQHQAENPKHHVTFIASKKTATPVQVSPQSHTHTNGSSQPIENDPRSWPEEKTGLPGPTDTSIPSDKIPADITNKKNYKVAREAYLNIGLLTREAIDMRDGQIIMFYADSLAAPASSVMEKNKHVKKMYESLAVGGDYAQFAFGHLQMLDEIRANHEANPGFHPGFVGGLFVRLWEMLRGLFTPLTNRVNRSRGNTTQQPSSNMHAQAAPPLVQPPHPQREVDPVQQNAALVQQQMQASLRAAQGKADMMGYQVN